MRHHLARRLLDDPVVYLDTLDRLDPNLRAYFVNQRGALASRLCEACDLTAEQRAEGLALVDENAALTDVAMPAEGTEAHVTLLVAEFLAGRYRAQTGGDTAVAVDEVVAFVAEAGQRYGTYWRKSARAAGAENELAQQALTRLQKLQLVGCTADVVQPRPALTRFAVGQSEIKKRLSQSSLFDAP